MGWVKRNTNLPCRAEGTRISPENEIICRLFSQATKWLFGAATARIALFAGIPAISSSLTREDECEWGNGDSVIMGSVRMMHQL